MKWTNHFIKVAELVSTMSKDPNHKIGAVIVDKNNRIVSTGFNGFAKGIADTEDRLNDKETKRLLMLHAEENAILYAKQDLTDCSIYVYGYPSCIHCTSIIIQSGIKNIYYKNSRKDNTISDYWKHNLEMALSLATEAGVNVIEL